MEKCPHCRRTIRTPLEEAERVLDDARWKSSPVYHLLTAEDFWGELAKGEWFRTLSRRGHVVMFFCFWPLLALMSLHVLWIAAGELIVFVAKAVNRALWAVLMPIVRVGRGRVAAK